MAITPVPVVSPTPEFPTPGDAAYNTKAFSWATFMEATYVAQIVGLVTSAYNNAVEALAASDIAASSAVTAVAASATALGASNFKGNWSEQTGAMNKPASVRHSARFWLLTENLPDVTTEVPGTSAKWVPLDSVGGVTSLITTNTTADPGVTYLIGASGITLTIPNTGYLKGDRLGIVEVITAGTYSIAWGTNKLRSVTLGTVVVEKAAGQSMFVQYEDATRGFV